MPRRALVCALAFGFASGILLQAQLNRGSITGILTDPSGAVIPAAKVLIRNTATGAVYETETSQAGQYIMPNLPAGSWVRRLFSQEERRWNLRIAGLSNEQPKSPLVLTGICPRCGGDVVCRRPMTHPNWNSDLG